MKVLVTGFEPFGPWQRNPSGETARHLDGATIVDAEITGLVLPVSFKRAAAPLIEAIEALRPDVVLNLGRVKPSEFVWSGWPSTAVVLQRGRQ